MNTTEE